MVAPNGSASFANDTERLAAYTAGYACGWYDKTRDDGLRFWAPRVIAAGEQPSAYLQGYLKGQRDRPDSGIRGVDNGVLTGQLERVA
jgi:hypothetical protein